MRYAITIICSFLCLALFLFSGPFACYATTMETLPLLDPEVVLPDQANSQLEEGENVVDDPSADSGVPSLFALSDSDLSGLASFTVSSNLGELTLYLPDGISSSSLRVVDGGLYNVTNATIYLFCPEFPEYTFSASRFAPVFYRNTSGSYSSVELTGVTLVERDYVIDEFIPYIVVFALVFIVFSLMWRRAHD